MEPIRIDEFCQARFAHHLLFSPQGARAILTVSAAKEDRRGYDHTLWLYNPENGELSPLPGTENYKTACWESEHTLLFPSEQTDELKELREKGEEITPILRYDCTTGEKTELFRVPYVVTAAQPAAGGVLLCIDYDNARPDLPALSGEEREKALSAIREEKDYQIIDELPYWQNGSGWTNKKRARLALYRGGDMTFLTPPLMDVLEYHVSKDGTRVLFAGETFETVNRHFSTIEEINVTTGAHTLWLPDGQYDVSGLGWYRDGVLFFGTDKKTYGINENAKIFYLSPDKTLTCVSDPDLDMFNFVGSDCRMGGGQGIIVRDGKAFFIATKGTFSYVYALQDDGTCVPVTGDGGSVDCFDVANGRIYFTGMRGAHLQELYTAGQNETESVLSHFNDGFAKDRYVAQPQYMGFTGKDGVSIDGWVLLPYEYDSKKKYPAILDIHGGPKGTFSTLFFHEMQYWAGQGYFVFFCNPRGGAGKGGAFADIRGKYGTIDYSDLMEFTDHVLNCYPAIDEKRVCVTGGSYGGFMTNWIIGHTGRFAAAASQRSIANWISKSLTTDIGWYFNVDQMGCGPWEDAKKLWGFSPVKYMDRCTTPTLFLHADEDYRCWMAEGLQMVNALMQHGVPTRMILFHGENHELSRSGMPAHRIRRLREITDWFNAYTK